MKIDAGGQSRLVRLDPFAPALAPLDAAAEGWGKIVLFLLCTAVLFAVACGGYQHWAGIAADLKLPDPDAALLPIDRRLAFANLEATAFFWALVVAMAPLAPVLWRGLCEAVEREDFRQALFALTILLILGLVLAPMHLGVSYMQMSLVPFGQESWGLHRRMLVPALASFLHLNGPFFAIFQLGLVLGLLTLLRAFLRRHGCATDLLSFASLASCSFAFENFQFPGYPDVFVLGLALVMLTVRLSPLGYARVVVLGLLAHETLGLAVLGPLLLWLPRGRRLLAAVPFALYGVAWAADFNFDILGGWHAQVDYLGASGPQLLLERPVTVLFGVLAANKLLWLVLAVHVAAAWRRGWTAAARVALPAAAAVALCVPSYDTSRMAGLGVVTLALAFAGQWPRLHQGAGRLLLVANLLLPTVYVSPFIQRTLGVVWTPGLYSLWPMAAYGTTDPPVAIIRP